jgi:hypothetical protein
MNRSLLAATVGAVLVAVLTTGCVTMPDSGPINETDTSGGSSEAEAPAIDAEPPRDNASPADIAKGFMDAMAGWPIQIGVARQYLSQEAAAAWNPNAATITFEAALPPVVSGNVATVELFRAERLDESGSWEGEVPESEQEVRLGMRFEDGQYRITNPPDALIVPADWFAQRFTQLSLYFFDQTGRILVPEPVFVPRGDQLASTLTDRLLDPGDELLGVSRSYLPSGDAGLSVPVTEQGVAEIDFGGSNAAPPDPDDPDLAKMLAQLGWTLRQVPGIRALRISIGGQEVRPPGSDGQYSVTEGSQFNPSDHDASPSLYALQDGRMVYDEGDEIVPAPGPLGEEGDHGLRSISVDLDGSNVVGVTDDGTALVSAPLTDQATQGTRTIFDGGTDLLPPAWDFTGRLWVVDNTPEGARVGYRERRRLVPVRVPDVSGRRVTSFLVSRDGTRFVAVVRAANGDDQVRAGRIRHDDQGEVTGAGPTRLIPVKDVQQAKITDIAWTSPTSILVVRPISGETSEVSTVPVDGAPTESLSVSVSGRVVALAASPDGTSTPYAVTRDGLVDLDTGTLTASLGSPLVSLTYVG